MEFTRITDSDHFYGVYLDLVLPVSGNPRISQVFNMNTNVLSSSDSPMTIVMISSLLRTYRTSLFAIDHVSGRFNIINRDGVQPLDLFEWVEDGKALEGNNLTLDTVSATPVPMAESTPYTELADITEGMGTLKLVGTSTLAEDTLPSTDTFLNPYCQAIIEESSVTTLGDKDHIENDKEYQAMVSKLIKVSKKHRLVLKNWSLERKVTACCLAQREVDLFYKKVLQDYENKKQSLTHGIEMYENFYQEGFASPTDLGLTSRPLAAGDGMPSLRSTTAPSTPTQALSASSQIVTSESQPTVVLTKVISCAPQIVTSISFDFTSTGPMEGEGMRSFDQVPSMAVSLLTSRIPPMPAARGWRGAHTTLMMATHTTPISREASR